MLFLHIFDEGFFKDGMGKDIDCHNCLFISTTNLASQTILSLDPFSYETALEYVEPQLIKALTPEFYNRVDPVIFQGLSFDVLRNIVKIKLDLLAQNVFKQKQVKVYFDEYLVDYIQTKGYHHLLGARPMQRLIKNELTALIARTLLREAYLPGDAMYLSYVEGSVIITRLTEEEAKEVLETNY
jgi:ATP-dependent Clp protease ATP-binding subunit ClpB